MCRSGENARLRHEPIRQVRVLQEQRGEIGPLQKDREDHEVPLPRLGAVPPMPAHLPRGSNAASAATNHAAAAAGVGAPVPGPMATRSRRASQERRSTDSSAGAVGASASPALGPEPTRCPRPPPAHPSPRLRSVALEHSTDGKSITEEPSAGYRGDDQPRPGSAGSHPSSASTQASTRVRRYPCSNHSRRAQDASGQTAAPASSRRRHVARAAAPATGSPAASAGTRSTTNHQRQCAGPTGPPPWRARGGGMQMVGTHERPSNRRPWRPCVCIRPKRVHAWTSANSVRALREPLHAGGGLKASAEKHHRDKPIRLNVVSLHWGGRDRGSHRPPDAASHRVAASRGAECARAASHDATRTGGARRTGAHHRGRPRRTAPPLVPRLVWKTGPLAPQEGLPLPCRAGRPIGDHPRGGASNPLRRRHLLDLGMDGRKANLAGHANPLDQHLERFITPTNDECEQHRFNIAAARQTGAWSAATSAPATWAANAATPARPQAAMLPERRARFRPSAPCGPPNATTGLGMPPPGCATANRGLCHDCLPLRPHGPAAAGCPRPPR